jgi:von Willebrand factor A domain-containing protein 5
MAGSRMVNKKNYKINININYFLFFNFLFFLKKRVQNSLQIFLRSIPIGTKFNLVSFGDKYESLFPSSREYDNNSFQTAIQHVNNMEANMGGTKILPPLKFILENPVDSNYPRQVFLLTDGGH